VKVTATENKHKLNH